MQQSVVRSIRHTVAALVAGVVATACATAAPGEPTLGFASATELSRDLDLGSCGRLAVPAGSQLAFRAYAEGVQIYRWSGSAWTFVAPEATLSANVGGQGVVGKHYAGPSWEMTSGSKVTGAVIDRCPIDAVTIPWLLLGVTSNTGNGVLEGVTHIQRVNTVAGTAPVSAGTVVGEEVRVPYTAEYYFYRAP